MLKTIDEDEKIIKTDKEDSEKVEMIDSEDICTSLDIFTDMLNRESRYYPRSWR